MWNYDSICVFHPKEKCFTRIDVTDAVENWHNDSKPSFLWPRLSWYGSLSINLPSTANAYQKTYNFRFYKRVICKRIVATIAAAILHKSLLKLYIGMLTRRLAWNDGFLDEGLSRTELKKTPTNWTINKLTEVFVIFIYNSIWVLLFVNLYEKGRNIFFIVREMMFWFTPFIISSDVAQISQLLRDLENICIFQWWVEW